ncbi:hypothetical protein PSQ19_16450 [Devosia algicola]|uniref:Pyridine nucleotide-disulphide oxidoreductase dimerisation domain-containing protein n=1 Tax=Devosia algicola TaxID=3026418 RepID=A0ABY7YLP4_9HYPH|nr:hypothetical protein [Devosia algicola]WDR02216.1 hypothetical protein PSQ19_16450 [Devosia algicola]
MASRSVYSDPEIAETGMTETEAKKRFGKRYRVVRCAFTDNRRAQAIGQSYGTAKMICLPSGAIVGAGVVGPSAGETIALLSLAIAKRLKAIDLQSMTSANPTLSEIVQQLGTEYGRDAITPRWVRPIMAIKRVLP